MMGICRLIEGVGCLMRNNDMKRHMFVREVGAQVVLLTIQKRKMKQIAGLMPGTLRIVMWSQTAAAIFDGMAIQITNMTQVHV